jgi:hypothetical protein
VLDRLPAAVGVGDVAGDPEGAHDRGRGRPALGLQARDERRPERVDDAVGEQRRHELAPQRVLGHVRRAAFGDRGREVAAQVALEVRLVGHVGLEQRAGQRPLGVGEQHRELGAFEALAGAAATGHLLGAR